MFVIYFNAEYITFILQRKMQMNSRGSNCLDTRFKNICRRENRLIRLSRCQKNQWQIVNKSYLIIKYQLTNICHYVITISVFTDCFFLPGVVSAVVLLPTMQNKFYNLFIFKMCFNFIKIFRFSLLEMVQNISVSHWRIHLCYLERK